LNLILILKELWRRRLLVVLSVAAAAAVSVLAIFQVSFSPPAVSKRDKVSAQGSIEILVDSANSPIADARRNLTGLSSRAGVFARLIGGGNVVRQIAKRSGIPVNQIDVAGPTPLPGEAPGVGQESLQLHPYGISVSQTGELPIVSVVTRAPTVNEARALADSTPAAVRQVVESIQIAQDTPSDKRVEFRVLGPAQAGKVDEALGKKVALLLFTVVFGICILLILGLPRFIAAWRTADSEPRPSEWRQPDQTDQTPEVVHLPSGRGDHYPGTDDGDASWIGQKAEQ
jgi:hypothetical protein